jgi:GH18 family chitinase
LLTDDFLVVGYLPDYRTLDPTWGNCLTDLIYFSAEPLADGSLNTSRFNPATLQAMQAMKTRYGTRIHISLGGYGRSDNFGPMVTDPMARQKFIDNLIAFAHANALDGIDFDWEFPANQAELDGYLALMNGIKGAGLIVSVALYPYPDIKLEPYLIADRVYIMSYDRGERHSTLEQAKADLDFFAQGGIPRKRLFLGVPFYGRQTTEPYTASEYSNIIESYHPLPEQDEVNGIYFNGIKTMQSKVCYTRQNGFGGIMIWELGQDSADDTSLLKAIYQAVVSGCKP